MALQEFVIFRHAQKSGWTADPELSSEGFRQAQLIVETVRKKGLPKPDLLISSPRKRAHQTLQPLHETFQVPLHIHPGLDERNSPETGKDFENRVKLFLETDLLTQNAACLYLCTHLDWLEVFGWAAPLELDIASDILHLPPAHYYHIQIDKVANAPWKIKKRGGIL
jgi:phosphohistidine phosphatase SixA